MVSVNRRWLDACIFPPRAAEPRPLKTTSRELYAAGGRRQTKWKTTKEKRREERSGEKKALKRVVASPRHGIYDVISSLTVNNFPRGCAEDTIASRVPPPRVFGRS
ncbi:unnamed protein product [Lasius platythorax]|uniref:Uncharacterized protein n=1 Tax=Lasius platythorax TaxID=488582 RepID=A0AAV2NVL4_9HYME